MNVAVTGISSICLVNNVGTGTKRVFFYHKKKGSSLKVTISVACFYYPLTSESASSSSENLGFASIRLTFLTPT